MTATTTAMSPISKWEQQQILHFKRSFLYNLYEHDRKFPFAPLFGGRNLGAVPWSPKESSPLFAILRELTEINAKKLKNKKTRIYVDSRLGTFSLPSPSSLLRHSITMKVKVPFWFYCKRKSIRISWTNCLHYKHCEFTRHRIQNLWRLDQTRHLSNSDSPAAFA